MPKLFNLIYSDLLRSQMGGFFMQYTLKDVLSNKLFSSAKLLSANKIVSSQLVESVSVMEIPVEDFVRKNEFVLTTAIGCDGSPDLFLNYVKDIYTSGAAAMGVAIGRHVQSIPKDIIEFCNKKNFPIIELPWEIRFSDITKTILEQINHWEQTSIIQADNIQRELLRLYLEHQSFEKAVHYLMKEFKTDVELTYDEVFQDLHDHGKSISLDKEEPSIIRFHDGHFMQVVPIHLSNKNHCFVLIKSKKLNTPPIPWLVLNQSSTILTLWIQKELTLLNNKQKELKGFLKCLLNGNWDDKEDFIHRGEQLGYNMNLSYVCIVGHPEKPEEFYSIHRENIDNHFPKIFRQSFSELIESSSKKLNKQIIYTFQRDSIVIFLECNTIESSRNANHLLDMIDAKVEQKKIPAISWGIGENHAGKLTFHLSYKNARTALEIGRSHKGVGSRSTFASTGIYQLLISLSNNTFATELMHSTIGAIITYDRNNGLDLLHTLSSYIYHQGNVSQTARALSLHRQSLLYRLRKIESLTNRSLNDPDDIFLLQFCLKLWTVR